MKNARVKLMNGTVKRRIVRGVELQNVDQVLKLSAFSYLLAGVGCVRPRVDWGAS